MFKTEYVWKLYVPLRVDKELGSNISGMLLRYYDGYTKYEMNIGAWDSGSEIYKELTQVYEIVTNYIPGCPRTFDDIIEFILKNSNEESVLLTKSPIESFFKRKEDYV